MVSQGAGEGTVAVRGDQCEGGQQSQRHDMGNSTAHARDRRLEALRPTGVCGAQGVAARHLAQGREAAFAAAGVRAVRTRDWGVRPPLAVEAPVVD